MSLLIFIQDKEDIIDSLRQIPNATSSHGTASFGYEFELKDGSYLVIGRSDDDCFETKEEAKNHIMWIQHYKL